MKRFNYMNRRVMQMEEREANKEVQLPEEEGDGCEEKETDKEILMKLYPHNLEGPAANILLYLIQNI